MDVMRRKCFLLFVPALLWSVSTGARITVNDADLKLQSLIIPHIVLSICALILLPSFCFLLSSFSLLFLDTFRYACKRIDENHINIK